MDYCSSCVPALTGRCVDQNIPPAPFKNPHSNLTLYSTTDIPDRKDNSNGLFLHHNDARSRRRDGHHRRPSRDYSNPYIKKIGWSNACLRRLRLFTATRTLFGGESLAGDLQLCLAVNHRPSRPRCHLRLPLRPPLFLFRRFPHHSSPPPSWVSGATPPISLAGAHIRRRYPLRRQTDILQGHCLRNRVRLVLVLPVQNRPSQHERDGAHAGKVRRRRVHDGGTLGGTPEAELDPDRPINETRREHIKPEAG